MKAEGCKKQKNRIGLASNPFRRVKQYCRRSRFWTWSLELIVGPFYKGANLFKNQWQNQSRKLNCRIVHGCIKALKDKKRNLRVWAKEPSAIIHILKLNNTTINSFSSSHHNRK